MTGTFYGIGVGPGDPELLTVKAIKTINKADVIVAPKSGTTADSTAFSIALPHVKKDVQVIRLVFPMRGRRPDWEAAWLENKEVICGLLEEGKDVAFLTLGDPMLFSTYTYVFSMLQETGFAVYTVPGVTALLAAASRAGFPLVESDEILTILPATADNRALGDAMRTADSLAVLKASYETPQLLDQLKANGFTGKSVLISRCGLPDEEIIHGLANMQGRQINYLSTILARRQ